MNEILKFMSLTDEQKKQVITAANSLYVFSENLRQLNSCDELVLCSERVLNMAQSVHNYALRCATENSEAFQRHVGIIKTN